MSSVVERLKKAGLVEAAMPEGCPAIYSFHAYCRWENPEHGFREFPHEADQVQTLREAKAQLRSYGWIFHDEDRRALATCPKCASKIKSKAALQASKAEGCDVPPAGWECTRQSGHEGPCAAVPAAGRD